MVAGATYQAANSDLYAWLPLSRYQQTMAYVRSRQVVNWIAIDDDNRGWPETMRSQLVLTASDVGVTDANLAELVAKLGGTG